MSLLLASLLLVNFQTPDFTVGVYSPRDTKLKVAVDNNLQHRLTVRLLNRQNSIVYEETISRKTQQYRKMLNLEELPEGMYRLEISDGRETVTKEVTITVPVITIQKPAQRISIKTEV